MRVHRCYAQLMPVVNASLPSYLGPARSLDGLVTEPVDDMRPGDDRHHDDEDDVHDIPMAQNDRRPAIVGAAAAVGCPSSVAIDDGASLLNRMQASELDPTKPHEQDPIANGCQQRRNKRQLIEDSRGAVAIQGVNRKRPGKLRGDSLAPLAEYVELELCQPFSGMYSTREIAAKCSGEDHQPHEDAANARPAIEFEHRMVSHQRGPSEPKPDVS